MIDSSYTQNLQEQIGQLGKLLGVAGGTQQAPTVPAANQFDVVTGIDGAKSFQQKMLSGTKHIVWDNELPKFYILQKDSNGSPARVQIGTFTLETEPTPEERFVTRDDFNALVARLDQFLSKKEDKKNG